MTGEHRVAVMAGAREAHTLTSALLARNRDVIASLPEPERMFGALPVPTRVGAFCSVEAAVEWLKINSVRAVFDASHAFDDHICDMMHTAARRLDLPYLRLLRPPWQATPLDAWASVGSIDEAARTVPGDARVFTNTGWATLQQYQHFRGAMLFVRQTNAVPRISPFPFLSFITGEPPFSQFEEEALFRRLSVSHLIVRNVGGAASMSKLLAARAMALPVLMIARLPRSYQTDRVETVTEALAWEARL